MTVCPPSADSRWSGQALRPACLRFGLLLCGKREQVGPAGGSVPMAAGQPEQTEQDNQRWLKHLQGTMKALAACRGEAPFVPHASSFNVRRVSEAQAKSRTLRVETIGSLLVRHREVILRELSSPIPVGRRHTFHWTGRMGRARPVTGRVRKSVPAAHLYFPPQLSKASESKQSMSTNHNIRELRLRPLGAALPLR